MTTSFNMMVFPSVAYNSEVPVGLQHHIFVETLLGRIQQIPLFPSEVHMHIIISHCILLDGRHGVPALGRARGEARGRGRLVVLMGLGHEFRHGDLVWHRRGTGAGTDAASVAQGAGSDPAAATARELGQREARARKSPQGVGATAGPPLAAGARAALSSAGCAPGSRRRRRLLCVPAQTRTRTASGNTATKPVAPYASSGEGRIRLRRGK